MTRLHLAVALALLACGSVAQAQHQHDALRPVIFPRLLLPSDTGNSIGYHVGGGALPHFGDARGPEDGTWGWDYRGAVLPRRVIGSWWHGRRYQGGTGAYRTDGPYFYLHDQKRAMP